MLASHGDLVSGAGIVAEPGRLGDAERWLEWWSTNTVGGRPEPFRANLDPRAPDFYDYTTTDWFATPRRTLEPRMAGPFVDYACTNRYTCTLAAPIVAGGDFLGVAAADVLVSSLERRVLPKLAGLRRRVALTTADERVVVSNDPSLVSGRLLGGRPARTATAAGRPPVGDLRLVEL